MTSHCDSFKTTEEVALSAHNRISSLGCAKKGSKAEKKVMLVWPPLMDSCNSSDLKRKGDNEKICCVQLSLD